MKTLKSLKAALRVLDSDCPECREPFLGNGILDCFQRKGDNVEFGCSFASLRLFHRIPFKVEFEISKENLASLEQEMQGFLRKIPKEKPNEYAIDNYLRESARLMRKARFYASFAPEEGELQFNGYCDYCLRPAQITIRSRQVWIGCSDCATIIADSAD